MTTIQIKYK